MSLLNKIKSFPDDTKIYFMLYLFCFLVSVWASGESFSKSFGYSPICYVVAGVIMLTASFCLKLVRESLKRGRVTDLSKFTLGLAGFLFAWALIFTANTHNFYYISSNNDLKKKELQTVKTQLELIKRNAVTTFESAKTKVTNDLEIEIKNLKEELMNSNNQGHGPKVDEIISRIEGKLGNEVDLLSKIPKDRAGLRDYGNRLADKIRKIRDEKLRPIDKDIDALNTLIEKPEYKLTQQTLEDLVLNYDNKPEKEIDQGLRKGYAFYSETRKYIELLYSEKSIIKDNAKLDLEVLPETPVSIESKHISFVWKQFANKQTEDWSNFFWAATIALLFDLACFILWFFFVLPSLEEEY